MQNKIIKLFFWFTFFLYILYINSGICPTTDDWDNIIRFRKGFLAAAASPPQFLIRNPLGIFYYPVLFKLGYHFDGYGIFRSIVLFILFFSIYSLARKITKSDSTSLTFTFLVIFFPNHDSMIFFNTIYIYNFAIIFAVLWIFACIYAFENDKRYFLVFFILPMLLLLLSYFTPPIICSAIAVFIYCWIKHNDKRYLKGALLSIMAFIIFFFYFYIICGWFFGNDPSGVKIASVSPLFVFKNFLVQLFSNIDAAAGPSLLFKYYFSINEILTSPIDIFIAIFISVTIVAYLYYDRRQPEIKSELLTAFLSCYIITLLMYAITGRYTQIAFGLGNRVTFLPTLGLVGIFLYLICKSASVVSKRIALSIIITLTVFSATGLSRHWKNTSSALLEAGIKTKELFEREHIPENSIIALDGLMYSSLGYFNHLEIFTLNAGSFFAYAAGKNYKWVPVLNYYSVDGANLVDHKFELTEPLEGREIFHYDLKAGKVKRIDLYDLAALFNTARLERVRHWIFLWKGTWLEEAVSWINPKFRLYFDL